MSTPETHPTPDISPISRQGHASSVGEGRPTLPDTSPARPTSFVLVDTPAFDTDPTPPDAAARTPDQILEQLPGVFETHCPRCLGEGSLEEEGSAYWSPEMEAFYPSLDVAYRPCDRCHAVGTVLDYSPPTPSAVEALGGAYASRRAA